MNKLLITKLTLVISLVLLLISTASADVKEDVLHLQQRWAEVNYQLNGSDQISAFEVLIDDAAKATKQYPDAAPAWIWSGIIKSTYAGAKGGLGALKYAKASKKDLEKALKIEADAMQGSAYTSLGTLYFNVPGWPVGFGNDDKAEEMLLKALSINPNGIDSNYFYADFLKNEKRYKEAETYLLKAQAADARPNRPLADAGRQKEIAQALLAIGEKLGK